MITAPQLGPLALLAGVMIGSACSPAKPGPVRVAHTQSLPALDGRALRVSTIEVTYPPGGSSAPHRHDCPVIGYVLDGAVRMEVEGERPAVYRRGESFYEPPGAVHLVSANESRELPARFLAWFVCDSDAPLSIALADSLTRELR